jgi:hypothetical protein
MVWQDIQLLIEGSRHIGCAGAVPLFVYLDYFLTDKVLRADLVSSTGAGDLMRTLHHIATSKTSGTAFLDAGRGPSDCIIVVLIYHSAYDFACHTYYYIC